MNGTPLPNGFAGDLDQHLVAFEDGVDLEQAETLDFRGWSLDAVRIGDAAAEHLVAAADSQDGAAAPQMGPEVDVPAEFPERGEIGDGRLRARQDDQRGVARHRLVRPEKDEIDTGIEAQRIEIVEIGDTRIGQHDDAPGALKLFRTASLRLAHAHERAGGSRSGRRRYSQPQRILCRQSMRGVEKRHQAQRLPAGVTGDRLHAVVEQRGIAAEAVDDEAHDHRGVGRIDHRPGADQARDHAAAVDVAQQHDRNVGGAREAHVGDVVGAQVDLRCRPRAFDQDEVRLRREQREAFKHRAEKLGLHRLVVARLGSSDDLALHDDLGADLALGLQQHRVHVHAGRHPRSARL